MLCGALRCGPPVWCGIWVSESEPTEQCVKNTLSRSEIMHTVLVHIIKQYHALAVPWSVMKCSDKAGAKQTNTLVLSLSITRRRRRRHQWQVRQPAKASQSDGSPPVWVTTRKSAQTERANDECTSPVTTQNVRKVRVYLVRFFDCLVGQGCWVWSVFCENSVCVYISFYVLPVGISPETNGPEICKFRTFGCMTSDGITVNDWMNILNTRLRTCRIFTNHSEIEKNFESGMQWLKSQFLNDLRKLNVDDSSIWMEQFFYSTFYRTFNITSSISSFANAWQSSNFVNNWIIRLCGIHVVQQFTIMRTWKINAC